jgi:hypothetical protein
MTDVIEGLGGATTVLLETPSMGGDQAICTSLLAEGVENPSVLFVSYMRQADACAQQWDTSDATAANLGVITVGDASGSTDREDVVTESVSTPSDLTGLGIQIGQFLSEWDAPVVLCFDSITSMLQYVDFETAYEFLHAVTGQVKAANARAHFHIDPGAHDRQDIDGIKTLFDASVSANEGETVVRTRDLIE